MNQEKAIKSTYFYSLMEGTGCTSYKYSDTPLELNQQDFNRLNRAVRGMLDEVDTQEYFDYCKNQKKWSLPTVPMLDTDLHGCADFLLTPSGAKLIEMNINLPGKVGLMETMGKASQNYLEHSSGIWTNLSFNEHMKLEIENALPDAKKIAILVSHFESSKEHLSHYQYFSEQLNLEGLDTTMIHANEILAERNGCSWNGQFYNGVINLVIPFVWESNQHEFGELTKLLREHPECIFPSPTGGMLGTKDLLSYLSSKRDLENAEGWKKYVLLARQLGSFQNVEELFAFLKPEQMVLKPFKDYGATGVHVKPDRELVEEIFATKKDEYMVQEFTDSVSKIIHTELDETVICHSIIYRVYFASKNPFGYQAYYLTGDLSGAYHSAPVKVISN